MDYPVKRQKYLEVYSDYLDKLVLNDQLIKSVKQLSPFLWNKIEKPSEFAIKSHILLELTKNRESCGQVIQLLRDSAIETNGELADGLQIFNTSPGHHTFGDEIYIPVTKVSPTDAKSLNTRNYKMSKKPRGPAVIINVVPNEVKFEAQRFYYIFEQLLFEPMMYFSLTTAQIKDKLKIIAEYLKDKTVDALIVMIITHGQNESIKGKDHVDCGGTDTLDIVPIVDIVDIFAEIDIIKVFFFTCCRNIEKEDQRNPNDMKCALKQGKDTSTNTFVFYSCAEGYETPYNDYYTAAGKILSESFAQYAYNFPLNEIINKTNLALQREFQGVSRADLGYIAPETRQKAVTHNLFFNPGFYE